MAMRPTPITARHPQLDTHLARTPKLSIEDEALERQIKCIRSHPLFRAVTNETQTLFLEAFVTTYAELTDDDRVVNGEHLGIFQSICHKTASQFEPALLATHRATFNSIQDLFWKLLHHELPYGSFVDVVIQERDMLDRRRYEELDEALITHFSSASVER